MPDIFYFRWPIRVNVCRVKMRLTVNRETDILFRSIASVTNDAIFYIYEKKASNKRLFIFIFSQRWIISKGWTFQNQLETSIADW